MKKEFNNQFATQKLRTEMSTTTGPVPGSATITPPGGSTDFYTTKKKKKKIKEDQKDVEPKLAAGEAENYVKDHWGWTEAPSIPNREDKGISYIKVYEGEESVITLQDILNKKGSLDHLKGLYLKIIDGPFTQKKPEYKGKGCIFLFYDAREKLVGVELADKKSTNLYPKELVVDTEKINAYEAIKLNENYSRFKKETKTRTNEQQLHAAMRLAEKKIYEANRILEYTTQLRTELNETRVNKNTQRLMEKITKGIAEAYGKMKKLK